jgi:hypothetical protein
MPPNSYPQVDVKLTLCALGIACEPQCRLAVPTLRACCSGTGPDTLQFLPTPDPTENASSYEGSVLRATALKQLDSLLGLGTAPNGALLHRRCARRVWLQRVRVVGRTGFRAIGSCGLDTRAPIAHADN